MAASESGSREGEDERTEKGGVETSSTHAEAVRIAVAGGDPFGEFVVEDGKLFGRVAIHGEPHSQCPFGCGGFQLGDGENIAVRVREGKAYVVFLY